MQGSGPSTGFTARSLPTEFEGEFTRLGGGTTRLLFVQARARPTQLVGNNICLGRPPSGAAQPAATKMLTIGACRAIGCTSS